MYTIGNYFEKAGQIDFSKLPEALQKGHEFVSKATSGGVSWDSYHVSEKIRKTIDAYFGKLADILKQKGSAKEKGRDKGRIISEKSNPDKKENRKRSKPQSESNTIWVERIPEEIRFIKRYVNLNGKTKTKDELLRFINSLQKAILEKRIRKTSVYADEIRRIQEWLITAYNTMKAKITLLIKPEVLEKLKVIAYGEKVMGSVGFIKRYISLNGKTGTKEKAKQLLEQINRAYTNGTINDSDPYIVELHDIKKNLENFLSGTGGSVLQIEKNTLSGLEGLINGCNCQSLSGIDETVTNAKPVVMNSMDFADMSFNTLGLKGKWLELIGDPSTNFTIMVSGRPKMGKSYLCIEFAGYLARNHGRVLYVAKEEGLDKTLQDKLNDKDVMHPNLDVASAMPLSLAAYDFVFLDSVNRLGLTADDLRKLKASYPDMGFVFVFQTTKDGKFRGANTFQHDVDSVIEVPERGTAVQYGRFNQGGEISIF